MNDIPDLIPAAQLKKQIRMYFKNHLDSLRIEDVEDDIIDIVDDIVEEIIYGKDDGA